MKRPMGTFLIVLGIVLIIIGIKMCVTKNDSTSAPEIKTETGTKKTVFPKKEETMNDNEQKGQAFEQYIESIILSNKQFSCIEHRSSRKTTDGKVVESAKYPDYDYARKDGNKRIMFSVECVVRKSFFKGNLDWAKDYQIDNWRNFQEEKGWPVIVVIGIVGNGTYDKPDDVYLLTLDDAKWPSLYESYLAKYKLKDVKNDLINKLLEIKENKKQQSQLFNQNEKNGFDFEIYFRDRITQNKNIICINHQSDIKSTSGRLPEASRNPDFDFALQLGKNRFPFSVECKVRKDFADNETISWAKDYNIRNYNNYQQEKNWPVFVAIGIVENGSYSNPEHLYILPLNNAQESILSKEYLSQFEISKEKVLYYDIKEKTLS